MLKETMELHLPDREASSGLMMQFKSKAEQDEYSKEDSFCTEYEKILDKYREKAVNYSAPKYAESQEKAEKFCKAYNDSVARERTEMCRHLQAYLIEKKGVVTRWAFPGSFDGYSFEKDETESHFHFNYFGSDYYYDVDKKKYLRSSDRIVFRDAYLYDKEKPLQDGCAKEAMKKFEQENRTALSEAEINLTLASERREKEKDKKKKKRKAVFGTTLAVILGVLLVIALICSYTGAEPGKVFEQLEGLNAGNLSGIWKEITEALVTLLSAVLGLILLVPTFISLVLTLCRGIHIGAYIAGIAVCIVAGLFALAQGNEIFEYKNCRLKVSYKKACKEVKKWEKEERKQKAAYQPLLEQFKASEIYKKAVEEDKRLLAEYELDKRLNEQFALKWQQAWFDDLTERGWNKVF